ncbi:hypothetical protein AMJ57_04465, partial [Parcubacteria bacterium SG8_24]
RLLETGLGIGLVWFFYTSQLNLHAGHLVLGLIASGFLSSLVSGRRAGLFVGLGVTGTFAVIGVHNMVVRSADPSLLLSLPLVLLMIFVMTALGSFLGDILRWLLASLGQRYTKA